MQETIITKLNQTREFIREKTSIVPEVGLILGSGLGSLMESSTDDVVFDFAGLPNFSSSSVEGHSGKLILGHLGGKAVMVMAGRLHYYEGLSMEEVIYPVRLMAFMGIKKLIITSAVGAVNIKYKPGDLVFLKDHINFMGTNALRGVHHKEFGPRFPDMNDIYDKALRRKALSIARKKKVKAHEGVYLASTGPSYETPAEIKAFRKLGADVVGMSVVPEAAAAKQMNIRILAISYVANMASGTTKAPLTHSEVLKTGMKISRKLGEIVYEITRIM